MHLSLRLVLALAVGLSSTGGLLAQQKKGKEKSPADLAIEAYLKPVDKDATPPAPAEVLAAGVKLLKEYPTNGKANDVIKRIARYGVDTMKDTKGKSQAAQRVAWLSQVQYAVLREGGGDTPPAAQAALKALAAATAGSAMRQTPSKENLADYRERIDRVAEMPEGARFLVELERGYIQLLRDIRNFAGAEKQATALLEHKDKKMQEMAQDELSMVQIRKQPLELTFTALDGKTVDVATLRGKGLVFLFCVMTNNEASANEIDALESVVGLLPKGKCEFVLVSCDKEENRAAVEQFVKKNRLKQPVWFAGTGYKNELADKLNVTKAPSTAVFDAKGMFVSVGNKPPANREQFLKILGLEK